MKDMSETKPTQINPFDLWKDFYAQSEKQFKGFEESLKKMSNPEEINEFYKKYDPFTFWKDMYTNFEKNVGGKLEEQMKKEEFSKWMGQILNVNLQHQKMMNDYTEHSLKQLNLPSKKDLASVATLIINLEEKVDDLSDAMDTNENYEAEMTQLKKDVKKLDKKMDEILQILQQKGEGK